MDELGVFHRAIQLVPLRGEEAMYLSGNRLKIQSAPGISDPVLDQDPFIRFGGVTTVTIRHYLLGRVARLLQGRPARLLCQGLPGLQGLGHAVILLECRWNAPASGSKVSNS